MHLFRLKDGNYTNQKFNGGALLLVALVLACFAISPMVQAVIPAPDGGYPGGNTAEGSNALLGVTTGTYNTAVGFLSLESVTTAKFNTAIGAGTLFSNTASENTATGAGALFTNNSGLQNTASGTFALFKNINGGENTAVGDAALLSNTSGSFNTAVGRFALISNANANGNTACGQGALGNNTIGSNNTALGIGAGGNLTTGNSNIDIGNAGVAGETNTIRIGDVNQSKTFITGIVGVTIGMGALPVLIDGNSQLGTQSSSRRYKKEIKPMEHASEAIFSLKPVTFHYKSDDTNTPQFGLIAEEVADVNPDLVVREKNGEIYTVRYDQVNAMLLNEFLKEHRKVEQLEKQIQALTAGLQKVSAQLEANKPTPRVVANNH